jgi:Zn-dependent peptidase ImmA (M78 family)
LNKRILRRLVPRHWNKQVFTWADFEFFCGLDGVSVYEQPLQERPAFYCVFAGSPSIFIDHKVRKNRRLWVLFHELAHHWLHTPEIHWFEGFDQRAEEEAGIVAACCLIPQRLLLTRRAQEIVEEYGYPEDLLQARIEIYRKHKI